MQHSTVENGHILFDGVDPRDVIEKFGSPSILYSASAIRENISKLRSAFTEKFDRFQIKYAMKANSNPAILRIVKEEGCQIDASSRTEIQLAIDSGFLPESIMFTANNVSKEELEYAVMKGVIVNFDGLDQVSLLDNHFPDRFSCRVKLEYGKGEFAGSTTSGHGAKFGMTVKEALEAYKIAKDHGVQHFGIHTFTGSNNRDPDHFAKVSRLILEVIDELREAAGVEFEFVDIGGGYGTPVLPSDAPLDLQTTTDTIHAAFEGHFDKTAFPTLFIEPGRFIVGNSAILVGTVTGLKKQEANYLGSDIGMNIMLRIVLYGAKHHIVICNRMDEDMTQEYEVVGQICENTDRIASKCMLPETDVGDTMVVFNAGAYVSSMSNNYNGRLQPAEVLHENGVLKLIRRRETYEDFKSLYVEN